MGRLEKLLLIASKNLLDDNLEEAIRNYNLALVIEGNNILALDSLGLSYYMKGEFQQAERFYQYVLELDSDNTEIRNELAKTYLKQNKFYEAFKEQTRILEKIPKDIQARVGLGNSYMGMKRYDDAIKEYSTVVKQGLKATVNLGWIHIFSRKKCSRIKQVYQRISQENNLTQAYLGLMESYYRKKEYSQYLKYSHQLKLFKLKTRVADFLYSIKP